MVEFKVVVNDIKNGKSHQVQVSGHHANSLIGKKIGDEVDGIFISLPGYKLQVTGGTDKNGFAMRGDFPGIGRRRLLLSKSLGFKPKENGLRKKKSVRGNTINQDVVFDLKGFLWENIFINRNNINAFNFKLIDRKSKGYYGCPPP